MQKAFIETQFPIARLSAETLKERNSGAGQTLTGLGKWWSKKQLIHVRTIIVRALMPASPNPKKDREIFLKSLPWMTKEHETAKRARFKLENGEMPRL
jgi:adenine-specific DNA methylase